MKVHEFQARELLADAGVPVPPGRVIESVEDAAGAYKSVTSDADTTLAVVKAQVHAGGRGKAGFVKLVHSADEATEAARFMLTNRMVSPQTPADGLEVSKLLIAAGVDIAKEYYLAILLDRAERAPVFIASAEGGTEIEEVAERNPAAILIVNPPGCADERATQLNDFQAGRQVAEVPVVHVNVEAGAALATALDPEGRSLADSMAEHEKSLIAASLTAHGGSLKDTYESLGLSRKALYEKISEVFKEITSINASSDADDDGAFHAWAYAQFGVPSFSTPVWVRPDQRKGDGDGEKSKGGGSGDENAEGNGEDAPGGVTSAEIQAMVAEFQSADQARQQEMMQEARSLPPEVRRRVMAVAQGRPDPGARSGSGGDGKKSEADKDDVAWLTYSDESRNGEGFIEWTSFDHPQLGEVEIGGFVPGFKLNPPPDDVAKLIDEQTAFAAALLERLPRIDVQPAVVERVGDGVWRISLEAVNTGLFPSQIAIAKKLRRLPGVTMIVDVSDDRVLAGAKTQQQQGLDGSGGMARAEWLLVGNDGDTIDIIVRAPALGETRQSITLND